MKLSKKKELFLFGIFFAFLSLCHGVDVGLFENISPGDKWGELKKIVKYKAKEAKIDGKKIILPNIAYIHECRWLLDIEVELENDNNEDAH